MKLPRFSISKKQLLERFQHISLYGLFSIALLIGGTFALWQLGKYYSPIRNNSDAGTTVILRVSDRASDCQSRTPLYNGLISADTPCYNYDINAGGGPTLLPSQANGSNTLFRIQGEIEYR